MTKEERWDRHAVLDAIDAQQWDFESQITGFTVVHNERLIMRRSERSNSPMANKVVRSIFTGSSEEVNRQMDDVFSFFGTKSFDWWVGPTAQPNDLEQRLEARGLQLHDKYVGLAFLLNKDVQVGANDALDPEFRVCEVTSASEADVRAYIAVSAAIWGLDEAAQAAGVQERMNYLALPERRGGNVVVYRGDKPVANASYRLSSNERVLYLVGSAVLPEYQRRGIYHQLLRYRFDLARVRGAELAVVQARVGTSEPILRKLGFEEYCTYKLFIRE